MRRTLPQIAADSGQPVDALRKLIRRNESLKKLGEQYGPTRVYTPVEAEKLLSALAAARGPVAAAT